MRELALLALVGCANVYHDEPARDSGAFTAEDAGAFGKAAFRWSEVTVPSRHVYCDLPHCYVGAEQWAIAKGQLPPGYGGWFDSGTRTITIAPGFEGQALYLIAAHELGHALRLWHTPDGVMSEYTPTDEFTPAVLTECRKVGACP